MKRILLTLLLASLLPLSIMAQKNPNSNSYGTYDNNKKFVDTESHCDCWIQPDGTVFIDTGSKFNHGYHDPYPETLTLPETVTSPDGQIYKVTGTAENSFQYGSTMHGKIKKLILPECYTTIDRQLTGGEDFVDLEEIYAPGLIYLGNSTFNNATKLTNVYMPKLKEVTGMAFRMCTSLETIDLPELEHSYAATELTGVFENCSALKHVNLPKLENMSSQMFLGCNSLNNLYLPSLVTLDPNSSQFGSVPDTLWFPKLKVIPSHWSMMSDKSRLKAIIMPELEEIDVENGFLAGATALETVIMPKLKSIKGATMFANDISLRHLELPSLEDISYQESTFGGCTNLHYISLSKYAQRDLTGYNAMFSSCSNLDTLLVPSMPYVNLRYQSKLTMLDISSMNADDMYSLTSWNREYINIKNVKHIICKDVKVLNRLTIAKDTPSRFFDGTNFNENLWRTEGTDYAGFDSVEIVNQTEPMEDSIFCHLPNIKHLVIHGNTKLDNMKAFAKLDNLETIDVAKDETGDYSSINGVLYDRSGNTLLYYPRANENNNRPFTIPSTLKGVGEYAFYKYPKVHQIAFGTSLENINSHAFDGSHINRVTFDHVTPLKSVGDYAFANMTEPAFQYLKFPSTLTTIGKGAFANDAQMQAIELYNSKLTTVPDSAFAGLKTITSIALPNSVVTIGANAFDGNEKMEYFTVPTACTSIGANAFNGTKLNVLNIQKVNDGLEGTLASAFPSTKPKTIFVPEGQSVNLSGSETKNELSTSIDGGKFYSFTRSYPVDLSDVASKARAFIVSNYNVDAVKGTGVLYTESLNKSQLSAVPANTPIILLANSNIPSPVTFSYKILSTEPESIGRSIVYGAPGAIRIDNKVNIDGTDYNSYILQWAESGDNASGVFMPVTAKEWYEVSTRKGEQSYLQLPSTGNDATASPAKYFTFAIGATPTGIKNIQHDSVNDNVWYNMQGQRVNAPAHGLYIHNGKKVLIP